MDQQTDAGWGWPQKPRVHVEACKVQEAVSLWEASFTSGTGCWGSGCGFFAGERHVAVTSLLFSSDLTVLEGPGLLTGCGPRSRAGQPCLR